MYSGELEDSESGDGSMAECDGRRGMAIGS